MLATIVIKYWKLILIFTVVGASASFGLSLAKKTVYVAESRLLIRYFQTSGVDAYAASRAAGKIAQIFSEVSQTDLFLDKVMATPFAKKLEAPSKDDPVARKEFWDNTISVTTGIDSTMLTVRAFSEDPNEPKPYVEAVSNVFLTSGEEFHGADGLVSVKLVDGPIVYKKSMIPSVVMSVVGGVFLGGLIGFLIALLFVAVQLFQQQNSRREQSEIMKAADQVVKEPSQKIEQPSISSPVRVVSQQKKTLKEDGSNAVISESSISKQSQESAVGAPEPSLNHIAPSSDYRLSTSKEPVLRTVFDDLKRFGLDPKELTVNN